jgi:REP element-mobilizing transposase RayT
MTTPRSLLVDPVNAFYYHIVSRCVRRGWLCDIDPLTGTDYSHRKKWLEERLLHLAQYFAVEVDAFSIMANHFHLVLFFDPTANQHWSDEEVAFRWVEAFPPAHKDEVLEDLKPLRREQLLGNKDLLKDRRKKLGCLSTFMKHLKQPIALRANREDGCKGHFFEQRFYSGALLSEQAVLASMAYVDLNPVRAKIARSLEECMHTSIATRLQLIENSAEALESFIEPLVSGLKKRKDRPEITLSGYIDRLNEVIASEVGDAGDHKQDRWPGGESIWFSQVASIRKRQKAFGSIESLRQWIDRRGLKRPGSALPE